MLNMFLVILGVEPLSVPECRAVEQVGGSLKMADHSGLVLVVDC